jgi:hypothetical protein
VTGYTYPAEAAAVAYSRGPRPGDIYNCSNFPSQLAAQDYLNEWPSDPSRLDGDNDGVACEENPCPCSGGAYIPPPVIDLSPQVIDPTVPPDVTAQPILSGSAAKRLVSLALQRHFRRAFGRRRSFSRACFRVTRTRLECDVSWRVKRSRRAVVWKGIVKLARHGDTVNYLLRVRRRKSYFVHRREGSLPL